ncbi:MAG: amphi-Trp domain-containing protein [Deltaproteobacteria bacterium]
MAIKKYKIEYDECRSLESMVDQLQSVVDGLRSRALTIAHGDRRLLFLLEPDSPLELGIHAERSGNRERLQISLEWRRQHLHIGGAAAQPGAPAEAGSPLEEGLEPEELEEGEVLDDDDDWEDQAETLRQGNNQLAQALQQSSLEH